MSKLSRVAFGMGLLLLLAPAVLWATASTDRSELDQFLKETANPGAPPSVGTAITMANWENTRRSCRSE
jgi:hypothetical protein